MKLIEYLRSLKWHSFSIYPQQGVDIYIRCTALDETVDEILRVANFNAVHFEPRNIMINPTVRDWKYTWLTVEETKK